MTEQHHHHNRANNSILTNIKISTQSDMLLENKKQKTKNPYNTGLAICSNRKESDIRGWEEPKHLVKVLLVITLKAGYFTIELVVQGGDDGKQNLSSLCGCYWLCLAKC